MLLRASAAASGRFISNYSKNTSDLNDPLKDSYIGKVADTLKPYTAELTTAGFDPTSRITQLGGAGELIEGWRKRANRLSKP